MIRKIQKTLKAERVKINHYKQQHPTRPAAYLDPMKERKSIMLFHSLEFLIFFPVVVFVYFIIPKKLKIFWLLAASYYFYMSWNIRHTGLIAFSTVVTWVSGLLLGRCKKQGRKAKWIVIVSIVINLSILLFFKYFDFF